MSQPNKDSRKKDLIDVVSQDKDWRGVVENELRCQENWQKEWGFLSSTDIPIGNVPINRMEKIRLLEEKLKSMEGVKIESEFKRKFKGEAFEMKNKEFNKRKESELIPQSRRPKAISLAHQKLKEMIGENYETEPYQNYLGSK